MMTHETRKTILETALLGSVKLAVAAFGLWAAAHCWSYTSAALSNVHSTLEAANDRG